MTDHPITPPDELVEQWRHKWTVGHGEFGVYLATQAARWGADQELEAIRQLLEINGCPSKFIDLIINARRRSNRDDDRLDALQRAPIKPQFPSPRKIREDFLP